MNSKLIPLCLSILAVICAGVSLSLRLSRTTADPVPVPAWQIEPEIRALGCKGSGAVTTVGELMQNRINPITSRLSFYLHHDQRPPRERLQDCALQAGQLLNCAAQLDAIPLNAEGRTQEDHRRHMLQMQADAYNLYSVSLEGNQDEALHWFSHLKQDCVSCHARFRAGQQSAAEAP